MAQQSARRDRDNQAATPYLEYATVIWTRSANSHAGPRSMAAREAGQMAASDYASRRFLTFSLAQKGASTDGSIRLRVTAIPDVFSCPEGGVHRCCTGLI